METNYQSLFFTSLTVTELKYLFKQELDSYFENKNITAPTLPEPDKFLNIREAGNYIKLSLPSMYRLCGEKKIPHFKKAGKILFSQEELLQWAKEGKRKTIKEINVTAEKFLEATGKKKAAAKLPARKHKVA